MQTVTALFDHFKLALNSHSRKDEGKKNQGRGSKTRFYWGHSLPVTHSFQNKEPHFFLWAPWRCLCDVSVSHWDVVSSELLGCDEHSGGEGAAQHSGHLLFHPDPESLTPEARRAPPGPFQKSNMVDLVGNSEKNQKTKRIYSGSLKSPRGSSPERPLHRHTSRSFSSNRQLRCPSGE